MTTPRALVYIACSLDGFIAGPDNDLSWLPGASEDSPDSPGSPEADSGAVGYEEFMAGIGAMLMGRATFDVVSGFDGPWPYGDLPVHAPAPTVRAVSGDVTELIEAAREAAGDKDIYLDGGDLIRQALDAGLVDEMTVTLVPIVLGAGHPLFAGATARHPLEFTAFSRYPGGLLQLTARPAPR